MKRKEGTVPCSDCGVAVPYNAGPIKRRCTECKRKFQNSYARERNRSTKENRGDSQARYRDKKRGISFRRGVTIYKCNTCGEDFLPGTSISHICDLCRYPTIRTHGRKMTYGDIFPCHNCCKDVVYSRGNSVHCKACRKLFRTLHDRDYREMIEANPIIAAQRRQKAKEYARQRKERLINELGKEGYLEAVNTARRERYKKAYKKGDIGGRAGAEVRARWRKESGYIPKRAQMEAKKRTTNRGDNKDASEKARRFVVVRGMITPASSDLSGV